MNTVLGEVIRDQLCILIKLVIHITSVRICVQYVEKNFSRLLLLISAKKVLTNNKNKSR